MKILFILVSNSTPFSTMIKKLRPTGVMPAFNQNKNKIQTHPGSWRRIRNPRKMFKFYMFFYLFDA